MISRDHIYDIKSYIYDSYDNQGWTEFFFLDSLPLILRAMLYTKRSKISITDMALPPRRRPMKPPISPENVMVNVDIYWQFSARL